MPRAIIVLLLAAFASAREAAENKTRVRYGIFGWPAPFQVAAARRWLDQLLPDFEFEWLPQSSGGRAAKKLANDELEFAVMGSTPFAWAAGRQLPVTAFYTQYRVVTSQCLAVRDGIRSPQDLVGRTIATPVVSTSHYQLLAVLNMFNLQAVNITLMAPGDIVAAWDVGRIDGAFTWQPSLQHILDNGGHILITGDMIASWGKETFKLHAVRNNFASAHPEVVSMVARVMMVMDQDLIDNLASWNTSQPYLRDMAWLTNHEVWDQWDPAWIRQQLTENLYLPFGVQFSCEYYYMAGDPRCKAVDGVVYKTYDTANFMFDMKWLSTKFPGVHFRSFLDAGPIARAGEMTTPTADSLRELPTLQWEHCPGPECSGAAQGPLAAAGACDPSVVAQLQGSSFSHSAALVPGSTCAWVVQAGGTDQVRLWLKFVSLQREEDWLRVYDGGNADGDLQAQLTGREIVDWPPLHSSKGALYIVVAASSILDVPLFTMNTYESGLSFEWDTFATGTCPGGCSSHGTCSSGTCLCETGYSGGDCSSKRCSGTARLQVTGGGLQLSSGAAAGPYASNSECRWVLESATTEYLELTFSSFALESNYDWVRVYSGVSFDASGILYEFTGSHMPPMMRLPSKAALRFSSDFGGELLRGFNATVRAIQGGDCGGDATCGGHGVCSAGACACDPGYFGVACAMRQCTRDSGVLSGQTGEVRTQAAAEESYRALQDCAWVILASDGPRGSPMTGVDLYMQSMDMEIQSELTKGAIPDFFAAGAINSDGTSSQGTVQSRETALIAGATVQSSEWITVFRAGDGLCVGDEQCDFPNGRCYSNASGMMGQCHCSGEGYVTHDCKVHKDVPWRIPVPAGARGVWLTFHTDVNNPPGSYAGVALHYEKVWECPKGDDGLECSGNGQCLLGECACQRGEGDACELPTMETVHNTWALHLLIVLGCSLVAILAMLALGWVLATYRAKRRLEEKRRRGFERTIEIAEAGVNSLSYPMVLVSATAFFQMGALLPYEEMRDRGALVWLDTMEKFMSFKEKSFIIFLSHQWLGWGRPDERGVHYKAMCIAITQVIRGVRRKSGTQTSASADATYIWCDFLSISQAVRTMQAMAVAALPMYAMASDAFVIIAPTVEHQDSGKECSLETYALRGWCRAEVMAKLCGDGLQRMYVVRGEVGSHPEPITMSWVEQFDLSIFHGDFSCCARKHRCAGGVCDKETLVPMMLGIYSLMLQREDEPHIHTILSHIRKSKEHFFPSRFTVAIADNPDEERELFGPMVAMMEARVRARKCKDQPSGCKTPASISTSMWTDPEAGAVQAAVKEQAFRIQALVHR